MTKEITPVRHNFDLLFWLALGTSVELRLGHRIPTELIYYDTSWRKGPFQVVFQRSFDGHQCKFRLWVPANNK